MAGEDPARIWQAFCSGRGDLRMDNRAGPGGYSIACTGQGCHRCTAPGCIYAGFIRQYWRHPLCD